MIKYALIALACTAGLSTAAFAGDDDIAVSATNGLTYTASVNIGNLDLTKARGKIELRSRLRTAVRMVCANDAVCNYTAERETARQASTVIRAANSEMAMAPTHLMVSGAR